jgi:hypothetical protein
MALRPNTGQRANPNQTKIATVTSTLLSHFPASGPGWHIRWHTGGTATPVTGPPDSWPPNIADWQHGCRWSTPLP